MLESWDRENYAHKQSALSDAGGLSLMVQVDSDEEETLCVDGSSEESAQDEENSGVGCESHVQWDDKTEPVSYASRYLLKHGIDTACVHHKCFRPYTQL